MGREEQETNVAPRNADKKKTDTLPPVSFCVRKWGQFASPESLQRKISATYLESLAIFLCWFALETRCSHFIASSRGGADAKYFFLYCSKLGVGLFGSWRIQTIISHSGEQTVSFPIIALDSEKLTHMKRWYGRCCAIFEVGHHIVSRADECQFATYWRLQKLQ